VVSAVFFLKIAAWHQSFPLQPCKLGEALRSDVARANNRRNLVKIVPNRRDFSVVFVLIFGHFRPFSA
jgi:hypothetical protein